MGVKGQSGITSLAHMFMSSNLWFFIFEKTSDLTLAEYLLRRDKHFDLEFIKTIAFDLLKSLQVLHSNDIVHLDLNLNNIMVLDEQHIVKNYLNKSSA
jgi:serine/threonine protein kinase